MKFKNKSNTELFMFMSSREIEKYPGFKEENVIKDNGLDRTLPSGKFPLTMCGVDIEVTVTVKQLDDNFVAEGVANGVPFTIVKDREIRKYDLYRKLVQKFEEVKKERVA